ncbi:helix-turn-helix domain-containing protein [Candidatus Pyrohabitans sp.]
MAVKAELRVEHRGCITADWTRDGRATLVRQLATDGVHTLFLVQAESSDALEEAAAKIRAALPMEVVSLSGQTAVLRGFCVCQTRGDSVTSAIHASGCSILYPVIYRDGYEFYTVIAGDRAQLRALLERLKELGEVTLERISRYGDEGMEVEVNDLFQRFTKRQLQALLLAYEEGYYDFPRRITTAQLASKLGVSRSTYEEHLRKAESRLMEYMMALIKRYLSLREGDA